MWGSWILERIKEPASSSISPTTRRDQSFDEICKELRKAYGGSVEVGHNIMETHLKIGKIPDPSNHPEAALKALIAHYECMEHASRFIDLSSDEGAEAEIMTGTYLKKILSFLPLRVRQDDDEFDKAETNATKRRAQYKKIKAWILKIREKLLTSGTRLEEDTTEKVTMVTVAKQQNEFKQNENDGYRNNRSYRAAKENQGQQGRERQEPSGSPVTECAYCELIRNKDVP